MTKPKQDKTQTSTAADMPSASSSKSASERGCLDLLSQTALNKDKENNGTAPPIPAGAPSTATANKEKAPSSAQQPQSQSSRQTTPASTFAGRAEAEEPSSRPTSTSTVQTTTSPPDDKHPPFGTSLNNASSTSNLKLAPSEPAASPPADGVDPSREADTVGAPPPPPPTAHRHGFHASHPSYTNSTGGFSVHPDQHPSYAHGGRGSAAQPNPPSAGYGSRMSEYTPASHHPPPHHHQSPYYAGGYPPSYHRESMGPSQSYIHSSHHHVQVPPSFRPPPYGSTSAVKQAEHHAPYSYHHPPTPGYSGSSSHHGQHHHHHHPPPLDPSLRSSDIGSSHHGQQHLPPPAQTHRPQDAALLAGAYGASSTRVSPDQHIPRSVTHSHDVLDHHHHPSALGSAAAGPPHYETIMGENLYLREQNKEQETLISSLRQQVSYLQDQVNELRQLPTGKISQIPINEMMRIMKEYGSEVSNQTLATRKQDIKKASVVRQFRRWNPEFFRYFVRDANGQWQPRLGKEAELKRRAQKRLSIKTQNQQGKRESSSVASTSSF